MEITNSIKLSSSNISEFNELGFVVIPEVVNTDCISGMQEELVEVLINYGVSREEVMNGDQIRSCNSYLEGSLVQKLIESKDIHSIAEQLLGGESTFYLPFVSVKPAGGVELPMHQDNCYTRHEPGLGTLAIWVALSDVDTKNGCLRVVPRSHDKGLSEHELAPYGRNTKMISTPIDKYLDVELNAGDAVAFTRMTIHGSGPNMSLAPRFAYALQYHRNDTKYYDNKSGKLKLLKDDPRFTLSPEGIIAK